MRLATLVRRGGCAAIAVVVSLLVLVCFWTAVGMPHRCGIEAEVGFAIFIVVLWFPVTLVVAIIAAVSGWCYPRWSLVVQAALIAICLAVVGVFQAIPHYDYPQDSPQCRIDL